MLFKSLPGTFEKERKYKDCDREWIIYNPNVALWAHGKLLFSSIISLSDTHLTRLQTHWHLLAALFLFYSYWVNNDNFTSFPKLIFRTCLELTESSACTPQILLVGDWWHLLTITKDILYASPEFSFTQTSLLLQSYPIFFLKHKIIIRIMCLYASFYCNIYRLHCSNTLLWFACLILWWHC